jgi:steroid 5-alpha reductase family enzyme
MLPAELFAPVVVCAVTFALCWGLSLAFREYSWVDRIWSVVPQVYVGLLAHAAGWSDPRLVLMTVLTTAWGARLTFNYARKGGYQRGGEDYRWQILRARMSPWQWQAFNFGFIALYQNVLLFLIALPAWTAYRHQTPLGPLDVVAAVFFVVLLIGEFVADQQQWTFQQAKRARSGAGAGTGAVESKGFVDSGLWGWSRHPNFFCEVGQWWMVYLFAVAASGEVLLPTVVGPVLLVLLFHGSTVFTESITAGRYPAYAAYQQRVARVLPWPPRSPAASSTVAADATDVDVNRISR